MYNIEQLRAEHENIDGRIACKGHLCNCHDMTLTEWHYFLEKQLLTCRYCGSLRPDSTELFLHETIYHVNKGEKLPELRREQDTKP